MVDLIYLVKNQFIFVFRLDIDELFYNSLDNTLNNQIIINIIFSLKLCLTNINHEY